jgi:hypothetical protein
MPLSKEKKETPEGGSFRVVMILLTAAVALFEAASGRYLVACMFAMLVGVYLWRRA